MNFPPWGSLEPTEEQLLRFMHSDTRQIYEMADMRAAQRQQLRDAEVTRWKEAQKTKSRTLETSYDTYTIQEQLGQGGAGFVYKAINTSGLEVAVKILDPRSATEEKRKRFKNELGFCEKNQHSNIITVTDRGVFEGTPFYVMPLFPLSLRKLLKERIPTNEVLPLFSQILDGVEAAHLKRVIHRDLKPENILYDPVLKRPVIADFGISHFEEEELYTLVETKDSARLANFQYAAPEQRSRNLSVDHRADIFALGLILNELFTTSLAHGTGYKTIATVAPEYGYLDEIVSIMIRYLPAERPGNIEAVKRQLRDREQQFFAQQRLSELRQKVIPTSDVDDPLIKDPPRLIDYDWTPDVLTLILSQPVNERWIYALHNMGGYSSVWGKPPEAFSFRGKQAIISATENEIQQLVNHFKDWLSQANRKYEDLVTQEKVDSMEREQNRVKTEIEAAAARERVRRHIKI